MKLMIYNLILCAVANIFNNTFYVTGRKGEKTNIYKIIMNNFPTNLFMIK